MPEYTPTYDNNYHYTTPIEVYQQVIRENPEHRMVERWQQRIETLQERRYHKRQASYRRMSEDKINQQRRDT